MDVSVGADLDFIELVRSGLLAALEALPPYTLFGLITFGEKVSWICVFATCDEALLIASQDLTCNRVVTDGPACSLHTLSSLGGEPWCESTYP